MPVCSVGCSTCVASKLSDVPAYRICGLLGSITSGTTSRDSMSAKFGGVPPNEPGMPLSLFVQLVPPLTLLKIRKRYEPLYVVFCGLPQYPTKEGVGPGGTTGDVYS